MKRFFVVFVAVVVLLLCAVVFSTNTKAEVMLPTENTEVTENISNELVDNSVETVDYLKNLYEKYGLITEEEYYFLNENLHSEMNLDFLLTLLARVHYFDVTSMENINTTLFNPVEYCIDRGIFDECSETYDIPLMSVEYCIDKGIFDDCLENYKVPLTRGAFAYLLMRTVDDMIFEDFPELREINIVDEGIIPDVESTHYYKDAIYRCYRYGLMLGVNSDFVFDVETPVTNYQVCVVLNRLIEPELRQILVY